MQRTIFLKLLILCSSVALLCTGAIWGVMEIFGPKIMLRGLAVEARNHAIDGARSVDSNDVTILLDAIRVAEAERVPVTEYIEKLKKTSPEEAERIVHRLSLEGIYGPEMPVVVLPRDMQALRDGLERQVANIHRGFMGSGVSSIFLIGAVGERQYVLANSVAPDGLLVFEVEKDEVYEDLLWAFREGKPRAGGQQVQTEWGNLVSGFGPLFAKQEPIALLEVDIAVPDLAVVQGHIRSSLRLAVLPAFGIALAGSLLFSSRQRRRLQELYTGLQNLKAGDFRADLEAGGNDEISEVATSVNELARALRQRESALERAVSKTVATELLAGRLREGGEVREATVLFTDIRGFTALSESISAEEVVSLLNDYLDAVAPIVESHGGIVDKFLGDGMLAVFGAPVGLDNDALSATQAALKIREAVATFNIGRRKPIEIGVGISTGSLVAGSVGSRERRNYTVLGHAVNVGARLCAQASSGQILIGETTFLRTREEIVAAEIAPLTLKGVTFQVRAFEVTSLRDAARPGTTSVP